MIGKSEFETDQAVFFMHFQDEIWSQHVESLIIQAVETSFSPAQKKTNVVSSIEKMINLVLELQMTLYLLTVLKQWRVILQITEPVTEGYQE